MIFMFTTSAFSGGDCYEFSLRFRKYLSEIFEIALLGKHAGNFQLCQSACLPDFEEKIGAQTMPRWSVGF